ncbi:MAG TPA: NUDIX domain-containing protein [Chthoniobacterales bacterium]
MSLSTDGLTNTGRFGNSRVSAGLLMFRRMGEGLEFFLVHPGGPFFARKDEGAWSIPKGEAPPDEDLSVRARIEFNEEVGFEPVGDLVSLGWIRQKGGKTVYAWAFEGELPGNFTIRSNTFELEWPPRSGKRQTFPEVDRAEWFPEALARQKINPAQLPLLDRLRSMVSVSPGNQ